jgi:hypothetical protein
MSRKPAVVIRPSLAPRRSIRALVTRVVLDDIGDVGEGEAGAVHEGGQALERADRRIVRRGQAFVQTDGGAGGVQQDEIGEGAADVEADPIMFGHDPSPC